MSWVSPGGTAFELYNNQVDGLPGWKVDQKTFGEAILTGHLSEALNLCKGPLAVNKVKIVISDEVHKKASDACSNAEANNNYCLGWQGEPLATTVSASIPSSPEEYPQTDLEKVLNIHHYIYQDPFLLPINSALVSFSPQEFNQWMERLYSKENAVYNPTNEVAVTSLNALLRQEINLGTCLSLELGNATEVSPFTANTIYKTFMNHDSEGKILGDYFNNPINFIQPITSK